MRLTTAAVVALFSGALYLVSLRLAWQAGHERARREYHEQALAGANAAVDALHAELRGISSMLAQVRAAEQHRNQEGEKRREEIRNALRENPCAAAAVPAAVADRLQQRAATRRGHADAVHADTGKSDAGNAGAIPAPTADVGRTGRLE
ncbi:hypothetical protein FM737_001076 [Escherichia marmotae]|nr:MULTISPECIES: DUF2570 domain-containing protein [Escherichia]KAF3714285.1 hypothetical protein FM737_001076 [Escherichia marmotae]TGH01669.1 DUF2570 domain-containing protein [Escherichia coli]